MQAMAASAAASGLPYPAAVLFSGGMQSVSLSISFEIFPSINVSFLRLEMKYVAGEQVRPLLKFGGPTEFITHEVIPVLPLDLAQYIGDFLNLRPRIVMNQ